MGFAIIAIITIGGGIIVTQFDNLTGSTSTSTTLPDTSEEKPTQDTDNEESDDKKETTESQDEPEFIPKNGKTMIEKPFITTLERPLPEKQFPTKMLANGLYDFSVLVPESGVWNFRYDIFSSPSINQNRISNHETTITIYDGSKPPGLEELIQIEIFEDQNFRKHQDLQRLIDAKGSKESLFSSGGANFNSITTFEYFYNSCEDLTKGLLDCQVLGYIDIHENEKFTYLVHAVSFEDYGDSLPRISDEAKTILNSFKFLN